MPGGRLMFTLEKKASGKVIQRITIPEIGNDWSGQLCLMLTSVALAPTLLERVG
jgi:hypothetical protein